MASLRQQIGQMLMMGFDGMDIQDNSPVKHWLSGDGLGGVLLFDFDVAENRPGKNISSQQQVAQLNQKLKALCADDDELPLFIAIDYEGGAVDRLKHVAGCPKTLTPAQLARLSDRELSAQCESMANTLRSLGFNLNFAPTLDLNLNSEAGIIGKLQRSFSDQPADVARVADRFVQIFADHGITCCYKHFPGHGSATGDTHEGFVDVSDTFQRQELEPYASLIGNTQYPAMIMTAHVINKQLDPSGLPATLSPAILNTLLREKMGYDGVIISDDLQMNAISKHFSLEDSLRMTINAGADMVIIANQLGNVSATEVIDLIENLVNNKAIPLARITQAWQRIVRLKQMLKVCA